MLSPKLFVFINSIKTKLIFSFLLIALVPLVYISYVVLNSATEGLLNVIVNNSIAHARKSTIDVNSFISRQIEILSLLNDEAMAEDIDPSIFEHILRSYDNRHLSIERIYTVDATGNPIAVSNDTSVDYRLDLDLLKKQLSDNMHYFFNIPAQSGRNTVGIVRQIHNSKLEAEKYIVLEINLFRLGFLISENIVGSSVRIFLVNSENDVLAAFPEDYDESDVKVARYQIENLRYGIYDVSSEDGSRKVLSTVVPVVGLGWKIVLLQDQQEVYQLVETFRNNIYWILFLTILIAVSIALLFSQSIALPIMQVTKGANELASGKYDVRIDVRNTDEVGQLAENFNQMAERLSGKIQELKEAYDELQEKARLIESTNVDLDRKVFEISILYKIGQMMSNIGIDLDRLLDVIIDKAIEAADAKRGSLMLLDETQSFLELKKVRVWDENQNRTISVEDFKQNIKIKPGEGVAGRVLQTGEMLIINDPESNQDFKRYKEDPSNVEKLCCVPLNVKNVTFGVINIVNKKDNEDFDEKDTELLKTMANQAALALENTKLFKLSITDGLTGLFMVRHFKIKLNEEVKRARRYEKIFSIVFFDIDHFKKFNDTYGHQVGDQVLIQVAQIFKSSLREELDISARYGGEEMIALLPETSADNAFKVAERLRKKIDGYAFEGFEEPLHVTISVGIAEFPLHDNDPEKLIKKADTALYECKNRGRNTTCIYSQDMGVVSDK